MLSSIANLFANGFPSEAIAKNLRHEIAVRGRSILSRSRPPIEAPGVESRSDACAPEILQSADVL
jgi:hypothetical protein